MKTFGSMLWGVVFIFIGLVLGLNALGIADINLFFNGWWTLFIIIPSFIGLFNDHDKVGNIIGLSIGIALLLGCQDIISFKTISKLALPVFLIILGISILLKNALGGKISKKIKSLTANNSNSKSYCATFSSENIVFDNEVFDGAEINSIFGGVKLDLRKAILKDDIAITTCSVFGGIDILVPYGVNVLVTSTSIFGGVDNKRVNNKDKNNRTIYVNATCIFGGTDIK